MKPEPVIYSELLVGGLVVKLPPGLTPYTTQRTMMAKILMSLKNKLNALIESPTGSGKWFFCSRFPVFLSSAEYAMDGVFEG